MADWHLVRAPGLGARVALLLLLPLAARSDDFVAGKTLSPEDPIEHASELDAMSKVMNSPQMEGKKFGKREISPDGKSGRIFLEPENPDEAQTRWSPQFQVSLYELRKRVDAEDLVMAYFFSSDENELGRSHENGKRFEEAARELVEGDYELSLLLVDIAKAKAPDDLLLLREWGVLNPHTYKVFVNGKPKNYRGSIEAKALVMYMNDKAGRPATKVETSEELDMLLANATWTIVVGVFGPAYQGASSRELFIEAARELRDAGRLSFVEVSTRVANGAARFANEPTPFDTATSMYAVVRSPKWLGKAETTHFVSDDFRKMHSFIKQHCWTTVVPFSQSLVSRERAPRYVASLLLDTRKHASRLRYIVKQYHKLVDALSPEAASKFYFAITERGDGDRLEPWIDERFERTTINGQFYGQGDKFNQEWAKDFSLVVSEIRTKKNWASNEEGGVSPDKLQLINLKSFLERVASGKEKELAQGDAAAAAAGLKEMKMGFGPDGGGMSEISDPADRLKKKGKKKKKAKAKEAKDEV